MSFPAELLRGAQEIEQTPRGLRPHRLPAAIRERFPEPQLLMVEQQPSGVRIATRTAARSIELVVHTTRVAFRGVDRPRGFVDVTVDRARFASVELAAGDATIIDPATGQAENVVGEPDVIRIERLPAGDNLVELWLPHNESVELVDLRADAPLAPDTAPRRLWVHHGSSISHGSNASSPTRIWPVIAAHRGDVELRSLGLGGSAMVDPFVARLIAGNPADLISVKLGINVINADAMRLRAFVPAVHGFLDTIRDGHPDTPLVLISPIFCAIHEDTPGPGAIDPAAFAEGRMSYLATGRSDDQQQGRLTLRVLRDALASLVERRASDPNLHYLDGLRLYGQDDATRHPLPDALHPDTDTHRLIGERFAEFAFAGSGPFAAR
ncbi:GDSL-type esterase/lipase family protein [Microbacterium pygmaeum]|uniref:GDSL-like Lipase/Acylhydrolase family protein n=1 Tax=Microbacterium pygmaeum TaxID=370764 RepID=A0A1G7UAT5_9MICO|nr:GDSL-type esterase/lipase family protein [Microbacterium pygmaeum]SDG44705.1 GDSL-like Lipase/Acylhydrolase family protein [Microbacterium pygmaeum]